MHRLGAFAEFVNVLARCLILWLEGVLAESTTLTESTTSKLHVVNLMRNLPE